MEVALKNYDDCLDFISFSTFLLKLRLDDALKVLLVVGFEFIDLENCR